jgi:hypothetical protein
LAPQFENCGFSKVFSPQKFPHVPFAKPKHQWTSDEGLHIWNSIPVYFQLSAALSLSVLLLIQKGAVPNHKTIPTAIRVVLVGMSILPINTNTDGMMDKAKPM